MSFEFIRSIIGKALLKCLSPIGYLQIIVVYSIRLDASLRVFSPPLSGTRISILGPDQLEEVALLRPDRDPDILRRRFREGHTCFIAEVGGCLAAYNWIAFNPIQEDEFFIDLAPTDVACLDAYTAPQYRGRSIHTALLSAMLIYARQQGFSRAFTRVDAYNRRSWKSHLRLGWAEEGTCVQLLPRWKLLGERISVTRLIYPLKLREHEPEALAGMFFHRSLRDISTRNGTPGEAPAP